jgi:hypothetical protein
MLRSKKRDPQREADMSVFRGRAARRPRMVTHRYVHVLNKFITKWHKLMWLPDVIVPAIA